MMNPFRESKQGLKPRSSSSVLTPRHKWLAQWTKGRQTLGKWWKNYSTGRGFVSDRANRRCLSFAIAILLLCLLVSGASYPEKKDKQLTSLSASPVQRRDRLEETGPTSIKHHRAMVTKKEDKRPVNKKGGMRKWKKQNGCLKMKGNIF